MLVPKNGYYFTQQDCTEYLNDFESNYDKIRSKCDDCAAHCLVGGKSIYNVTFVVTESCNLNCTYCYEKHKTCAKMSKEVAKQAVDFLFSDKIHPYFKDDVAGFIIEFIGGEPFLVPEIVDYVATYFKEKALTEKPFWIQNSMFNATSNGTLYFDEKVQTVINKHKKKFSIGITIDGNKDLHDACRLFYDGRGSYDIVEKAVKDWGSKSSMAYTSTKVTLAPENIPYIFEAFKNLWENVGIKFIFSNCVFENVWNPEHAQVIYDQLVKVADYLIDNDLYDKYYVSLFDESIGVPEKNTDRNSCGGNGDMLAIGPDGRLYPCMRFMDFSLVYREGKCIGDVYNGINMEDPWLKELKDITLESQSPQQCLDCQISEGCGLCTAWHYDIFGDANQRATFICDTHKARVCANAYYWNKLYNKLGLDKEFVLNMENIFIER